MNYLFKDNKNNTNNTRMRRKKLNRGGDGDAHHRPTTERSYIDKRWSSESRAKLAWAMPSRDRGRPKVKSFVMSDLSDVWFRTRNRPPLPYFVRIIRKEIRRLIILKDFGIDFWKISRAATRCCSGRHGGLPLPLVGYYAGCSLLFGCPYAWMFSYSSIFFLTNIIKWNYPEK